MTKDERRSVGCLDQGVNIFDLAFDRIGRCVATVAAALGGHKATTVKCWARSAASGAAPIESLSARPPG